MKKIGLFLCTLFLIALCGCSSRKDARQTDEARNDIFQSGFAYVEQDLLSERLGLTLHFVREEAQEETEAYRVAVLNADGEQEYLTEDSYRVRDRLLVTWDEKDTRFWVYSGDVGTFLYECRDGERIKRAYSGETYPSVFHALEPDDWNEAGEKT